MTKNVRRIIGQLILNLLLIFLGGILIYLQIPGNGGICDADQMYYVTFWFFFIIISLIQIINSIRFLQKGHWREYRLVVIFTVITIFLFSAYGRQVILITTYGFKEETLKNKNDNGLYLNLRLFRNGKFYGESYNLSCEKDALGTYLLKENELLLNYKKRDSEYFGTRYQIINNEAVCVDCKFDADLVFEK